MSRLKLSAFLRSQIVKNSFWGIFSNVVQTLFVGIFFIILARRYPSDQFAQFLIGTTVYQLVASFSSLGLGQWFIRKYASESDKADLTEKFLKTQLILGVLFYLINIGLAYVLYPDSLIRMLCLILGTNIIFDNFINAIRNLNIAESKQKTTAKILIGDSSMKLLIAGILFILPVSLINVAFLTILARAITVTIFISQQSAISFKSTFFGGAGLSAESIKLLILKNWRFIIIGSVSVIYWRIGNVIISKILTLNDVASYEIAYRFFSVAQIIPVIASATVYPRFVEFVNAKDMAGLRNFYRLLFGGYTLFAVIVYIFFYSFADDLVPLLFGDSYPAAALCLQQMFLTFLLMPTVLLQANLIVAQGLESRDMWFNIISLTIYVSVCFIGLHYYYSLAVINYSIFFSFIVFHVLQDFLLLKKGIMNIKHCLLFYSSIAVFVLGYQYSSKHINGYVLFASSACILTAVFVVAASKQKRVARMFNSTTVTISDNDLW